MFAYRQALRLQRKAALARLRSQHPELLAASGSAAPSMAAAQAAIDNARHDVGDHVLKRHGDILPPPPAGAEGAAVPAAAAAAADLSVSLAPPSGPTAAVRDVRSQQGAILAIEAHVRETARAYNSALCALSARRLQLLAQAAHSSPLAGDSAVGSATSSRCSEARWRDDAGRFDAALCALRQRRTAIVAEAALAAVQVDAKQQELGVLVCMAARDEALRARLGACREEMGVITAAVGASQAALSQWRARGDAAQATLAALPEELASLAQSQGLLELLPQLTRAFRLRDRAPPRAAGGAADGAGGDDDDFDVDDEYDDGDFDLAEGGGSAADVQPAGCNGATWAAVQSLRVRRRAAEEELAAAHRAQGEQRRQLERLAARERGVARELAAAQAGAASFSHERQARLNAIATVVPLRLGQLPAATDALPAIAGGAGSTVLAALPPTLDSHVLFSVSRLAAMRARLAAQEALNERLRGGFAALEVEEAALTARCRVEHRREAQLQHEASALLKHKFGRSIAAAALDAAVPMAAVSSPAGSRAPPAQACCAPAGAAATGPTSASGRAPRLRAAAADAAADTDAALAFRRAQLVALVREHARLVAATAEMQLTGRSSGGGGGGPADGRAEGPRGSHARAAATSRFFHALVAHARAVARGGRSARPS